MEPKIKPLALSSISRDDIRNALHTHFQTQATKQQQTQPQRTVVKGSGRKRVYSFVQVQKKKVSLTSKRLFATSTTPSTNQKHYILCVSLQESAAQLHYLQFLSNFSVDVRQTWEIGHLDVIENNGMSGEKAKRGAFTLYFEQEDTPWHWLVDEHESPNAMMEFVWSLCALSVDKKNVLPRLVRFNIEDLNEIAIQHHLQKKYGIDVDLLDHMAATKATKDDGGGQQIPPNDELSPADDSSKQLTSAMRLSAAENDDAAQLLAGVNWNDVNLHQMEETLKKKLRNLEDENLTFLLSFEGEAHQVNKPSNAKTSVDKIVAAIDTLLSSCKRMQDWTLQSNDTLERTSMNMMHFESLNNQLEVHFKNSVALEEVLENMMTAVDVPRDQMALLLKPIAIFPDETAEPASDALPRTIATIQRVDAAIKSTRRFPASDMAAFRLRGDELVKLAKACADKLASAFDAFLQRRVRQWAAESRASTAATPTPRHSMLPSASRSSAVESRGSRVATSFEGDAEMDWNFSNEAFHRQLQDYRLFFGAIQSLDPLALQSFRQTYVKHLANVYGPHLQSLFRCLRDKLPKASSKSHFTKPQALQSWSFHLSSSHLGDALGASALLQQAMDHVVPLVTREQAVLRTVFFQDDEHEGLMVMMEGVFEKLLKRMVEFGEAASSRNILDALALVVLLSTSLASYQRQSEFLYNVLVSFQLQMKRLLIKFTDDQETWIHNHHNTDTRMAGVLSPIQKTLTMLGRLEEAVCGKSEDSTLLTIYHRIVPVTMHWLDKISESKPKYTTLTRLENYYFMSDRLLAINATKELPLAQYAAQAHAKYQENVHLYVQWIWNDEFKQLAPLFTKIEDLLRTLPQQEIPYHAPRQDVRKVLDTTTTTFEKSVKTMHDRMKKHFSVSPKMLPMVWKLLVAFGTERLGVYERIAADCYQLRLDPTSHKAIEMLQKYA